MRVEDLQPEEILRGARLPQQAELQVRFDVTVPYDPYFGKAHRARFGIPYTGQVEMPNLEVNYSWDQDNDGRWDYKMSVSANYAIDEVVEFPDFAVKSVPYDQIIPWVKNRTWDGDAGVR